MAILPHPWALKNLVTIVKRLKGAGLHGIEVYRSDGKLTGTQFSAQNVAFFPPYVAKFTSPMQHQVNYDKVDVI